MQKYYFAYDGYVQFTEQHENDSQAFARRCFLEKQDGHNWKVYDERFNQVYGLLIAQ